MCKFLTHNGRKQSTTDAEIFNTQRVGIRETHNCFKQIRN
jgi:hypothetical protein